MGARLAAVRSLVLCAVEARLAELLRAALSARLLLDVGAAGRQRVDHLRCKIRRACGAQQSFRWPGLSFTVNSSSTRRRMSPVRSITIWTGMGRTPFWQRVRSWRGYRQSSRPMSRAVAGQFVSSCHGGMDWRKRRPDGSGVAILSGLAKLSLRFSALSSRPRLQPTSKASNQGRASKSVRSPSRWPAADRPPGGKRSRSGRPPSLE
jgi:hypothetical protein